MSLDDLATREKAASHLGKLTINTIFFVLGFSLVFITLGAFAGGIGGWLREHLTIFNKVAGLMVFLFGLHVAGVFKVKALNYEKRFNMASTKRKGIVGSLLIGIAFAFGWTPCIGPILGSILTLAAQQEGSQQGVMLLVFYSAGLGIPFILTALLFNYMIGAFGFIKRHFRMVEMISGGLLMVVGVLIFFDLLQRISGFILDVFPSLGEIG